MKTPAPKTVAVLYATTGGMGDVGKFAVALSKQQRDLGLGEPFEVRAIAVSVGGDATRTRTRTGTGTGIGSNGGEPDLGISLDVQDADVRSKTENLLNDMRDEIVAVDVAAESAEAEIGELLEGVDAVVSCLGDRQVELGTRWCALGTRKVIGAMTAKKVPRLVCLSSFGIGKDCMKPSFIKVMWGIMLRTSMRAVRRDLTAMETAVVEGSTSSSTSSSSSSSSDLDYLLVRPVGLTPSEPERGFCDRVLSKHDHGGRLHIFMSKVDAARFLLEEALAPTLHRRGVTIGYAEAKPNPDKDKPP
eukprot:CAMPEP_0172384454 /NCGR_PEP_ID=MMETSP1061-20121228/2212_1 /TAXON_ID=37318 /ORGANISM="Pseudo-nitzschia pungens, Strain cf. pungens" /LENGTH=302 /DNA_ID=CAMNT_0013113079 /DNA_START=381 /DNA_END=1289 /DNA_ORIENTATION=+